MNLIPNLWVINEQQDSHEFFNHLIDSSMDNQFKTQVHELVECKSLVCISRQISSRFEQHTILSLALENTNAPQSIEYNLSKHCLPELLSEYQCDGSGPIGCNQFCCYISQSITLSSNYLIIHLKTYDNTQRKPDNLHIIVDGHLQVNQESFDLLGIIYHQGQTMNCGHYFAELCYNNSWYQANDSKVKPISRPTAPNPSITPYILLYKKHPMFLTYL